MSLDKRIITHGAAGTEFSNGFIFTSMSSRSFTAYKKLVAVAKADFPLLTDDDIECEVVHKSRYMQGFPYVRFRLPANAKKKGYEQNSKWDWS